MGEGREKDEAFVTLATNDTYALGCLVLGSSLRRTGTARQLVVLVTGGVSSSIRNQLGGIFDHTVEVNVLDSHDTANLELLGRPDLSVTFTKLHCWRLTQFKKCVFLDADTLVLQNIDELFDKEELSAAPDPGWPDCFNSGVFVYVPSDETYRSLVTFAITTGSFDGGDQGLLNLYFSSWATADISRHLSFTYNVVSQAFYSYLPALKQFHDAIKVVHFIGPVKPWHHAYNTATRTVTQLPNTINNQEFLQLWWDIFMESVQPSLDPSVGGIVGDLANLSLLGDASSTKSDLERRLQWEHGQADYMGVDKFDNIKARLDEKIAKPLPSGSKTSVVEKEVRSIASDISSSNNDGLTSVATLTGEDSGIQDCEQGVALSQTHGVNESEAGVINESALVDSVTSVKNQSSHGATDLTQPVPDVIIPAPVVVTSPNIPTPIAESTIPASTAVAVTPAPKFDVFTPDLSAETVTLSPVEGDQTVTPAFISDAVTPDPSDEAINSSLISETIILSSPATAVISVPTVGPVTQASFSKAEVVIPSPQAEVVVPASSAKTVNEAETVASAATFVISSPSASDAFTTPAPILQLPSSSAQPLLISPQSPAESHKSVADKPDSANEGTLSTPPKQNASSGVSVPQAVQSSHVTTPISLQEQSEPIPQPKPKPISEPHSPTHLKPTLASASFSPSAPPTASKPSPGTPPTAPKSSPFALSTAPKPSPVASPIAAKLSPTSPPPVAPKPILTPTTTQTTQPTLPTAHVTEPSKTAEPKYKTTPFSLKKEEPAPPSKPWAPPATTQPSSTPKPGDTSTDTKPKPPPSAVPKPLSLSSVAAPKTSLIASQASKFEKPAPVTSGAAASKPTSPFAQMASRFESPGAAAKSPAVPTSAKTTGASASLSKAPAPTSGPTPTSGPRPTSGPAPTSGPRTNRDDMLSRFGVRLPPPKK